MADPISIIASALTIGASAAQLSLALFSVVQTLKNAPQEIAEIAGEMSLLAGSLQTLGDTLGAHRNLCKPALFKNTRLIVLRYEQVAGEIRMLINKPNRLAGLKWALKNKPKAIGLLKKVEGIKTALILELNIVLLAREESNRYPDFEFNAQPRNSARFNRYRRIVESTVQANRQVVESAQQEDEKFEVDTRRYTSAEIDVWKRGSSDTATWLYHLVFSSEDTSPPTSNPQTRQLHQASVTDENAETTVRSTHSSSSEAATAPKRRSSSPSEKTMILWSKQTEPGLVVDRLLFSWTTLSTKQIDLSSTRHDGVEGVDDDDWREGILKMVEEAKEEEGLSFAEWEEQNTPVGSDDEAFQSAEEDSTIGVNKPTINFRNNAQSARKRNVKSSDHTDRPMYTNGLSPTESDSKSKRNSQKQHVTWQKTTSPIRRTRPHLSRATRYVQKERTLDAERPPYAGRPFAEDSRSSASRVHTIHSDQTDSGYNAPGQNGFTDINAQNRTNVGTNPFIPRQFPPPLDHGYIPPWQRLSQGLPVPPYRPEPPRQAYASADRHWSYSYPPPSPPPVAAPPPPPPPPLPNPAQSVNIQSTAPEIEAKENAVVAAVEELLAKRNQESRIEYEYQPFSKLAQILQERDVQSERERANATTEMYIKQIQEAREKDGERMQQLESFLAEQRAEQRRMEIMWEEERKDMEAKAAKQAQEVRDSAAKEIAAAQLAKEAAQVALNVEKLEAEKEARKRADARVVEERKKTEDGHKLQLQRYEELVRGLQEQQQKLEQDDDRPVRHTRIAEGNRSVDVTEYMTTKRASPLASSSSSLQDSFTRLDMRSNRATDHHWPQKRSRHDSFRSSTASLHSSRTSLRNTNASDMDPRSQQMIVFPVKADRHSKKIAELQTSLAGFGIDSVFEDPEEPQPLHFGQLIPFKHEDTSDQIVRSTIFWEASALRLGSELLMTMKQAGWRPTYTRISGKGQTHYLGSQPIHTYFFNPDYKPQFRPSTKASANESITIQKALVEEDALIELGFGFKANEAGIYILDGRLTYNDIETLVELSFLARENDHRKLHRQLQWHCEKDPEVPMSSYPETHAPSLYSASSVYSGENSTVCEDTDIEIQGKKSSAASDADQSEVGDVNNFLVPRSEGSRRSVTPSSVASRTSRTSKSANPWEKYMNVTEDTGVDSSSRLSDFPNLID